MFIEQIASQKILLTVISLVRGEVQTTYCWMYHLPSTTYPGHLFN